MKTILLIGKNGQVGFELQKTLKALGRVVLVGHEDCDLVDTIAIRQLIRHTQPKIIVNAAAMTAVDKAQSERDLAFAVNATAPQIIGEEAKKIGAQVIHFSTDYVYDGKKNGAYIETDQTNPQGVYGASKLLGEQNLIASKADSIILRTSWVLGANGNNFAKTMLRIAGEQESLNIVNDQWGAPTSAALLAEMTAVLVKQINHESQCFQHGVYHLVASGETNWHEYAVFVIETAREMGAVIKVSRENINPVSTNQYPTLAKRPYNSRLNTKLFQKTFNVKLPSWQEGVIKVLKQIL